MPIFRPYLRFSRRERVKRDLPPLPLSVIRGYWHVVYVRACTGNYSPGLFCKYTRRLSATAVNIWAICSGCRFWGKHRARATRAPQQLTLLLPRGFVVKTPNAPAPCWEEAGVPFFPDKENNAAKGLIEAFCVGWNWSESNCVALKSQVNNTHFRGHKRLFMNVK